MNETTKKGTQPVVPAQTTKERDLVLCMRHGRGRLGGSTLLDLLIQLGRAAGRSVLVGDGDRGNPTLSALYPPGSAGGATRPKSDEVPDVKDWITDCVGDGMKHSASVVIDLGGGDRVMQEYGHDLALVEFCEALGAHPLGLFFAGPELDDFEHVLAVWRAGYFRPTRSILVLNEHLVPQGRTPQGAFNRIMEQDGYKEMTDAGVRPIFLPRLPCMEEMRSAGLGFADAASGRPGLKGTPLGPVRQFMVKQWVGKIQAELKRIKALEWLP
jgi:hypothetical protein